MSLGLNLRLLLQSYFTLEYIYEKINQSITYPLFNFLN